MYIYLADLRLFCTFQISKHMLAILCHTFNQPQSTNVSKPLFSCFTFLFKWNKFMLTSCHFVLARSVPIQCIYIYIEYMGSTVWEIKGNTHMNKKQQQSILKMSWFVFFGYTDFTSIKGFPPMNIYCEIFRIARMCVFLFSVVFVVHLIYYLSYSKKALF